MRFMLDTSACVAVIRQKSPAILRRLLRIEPDEICISAITLSELEYGVARSAAPERNRLTLAEFMAPLTVLPYDGIAAAFYGDVRASLESKGTPIGSLDTLIAAHALSRDLTVVTTNEREFRRVEGLRVAKWSERSG